MRINDSPFSKQVHAMGVVELSEAVTAMCGEDLAWAEDTTAAFSLVEKLNILKPPIYFHRGNLGGWIIKEKQVNNPVAKGDTIAEALCRAILIKTSGKRRYYSEFQES